jgi:hypothetical protein
VSTIDWKEAGIKFNPPGVALMGRDNVQKEMGDGEVKASREKRLGGLWRDYYDEIVVFDTGSPGK